MRHSLTGRLRAAVTLPAVLALGAGAAMLLPAAAGASSARSTVVPHINMLPNHFAATHVHSRGGTVNASSTCWSSSNWSGYAVSQAAVSGLPCVPASGTAYTSIGGTWTVPTVTGSSRGSSYSSAWIGIDGFSNSNLIQSGTEEDYYSGKAHYNAWWEILPAAETVIPSITIDPGDSITVSIVKGTGTNWTITFTDNGKTGHAAQTPFVITKSYTGVGSSAEWILEAPEVNGRIATLANYGSTVFDKGTVNGASVVLAAANSGAMVQGRGQVSTPSLPDTGAPAGDGFAVQYGATAPPAPTS
jgi:hypothetical protein